VLYGAAGFAYGFCWWRWASGAQYFAELTAEHLRATGRLDLQLGANRVVFGSLAYAMDRPAVRVADHHVRWVGDIRGRGSIWLSLPKRCSARRGISLQEASAS